MSESLYLPLEMLLFSRDLLIPSLDGEEWVISIWGGEWGMMVTFT